MIALDTNVLVRFLIEDDPEQCRRAARLIDRAVERGETIFLSDVVVCETVWVLTSAYGTARAEIADVLDRLVSSAGTMFESSDRLAAALSAFREGGGDFADYLIREGSLQAGAGSVHTFDKALLREPGFNSP